jgi:hypothetical protein
LETKRLTPPKTTIGDDSLSFILHPHKFPKIHFTFSIPVSVSKPFHDNLFVVLLLSPSYIALSIRNTPDFKILKQPGGPPCYAKVISSLVHKFTQLTTGFLNFPKMDLREAKLSRNVPLRRTFL